jgi:predicted phage tail component-like protein
MLDIEFNGVLASSLNLVPKYTNRTILPQMNQKQKVLLKRDGFYDYGDNYFKERIISVEFSFKISDYNLIKNTLRDIAAWLYTTEQKELYFTDEYDKYYLARVYHSIDWEEATALGKFSVDFFCQPWAFSSTTTSTQTTGITSISTIDFYNDGNKNISLSSSQGAYSLITIYGSYDDISLSLNGYDLASTASVTTKTIEIDNVNLTIENNSTNDLSNWYGDFDTFLKIIPRENTLTIDGTNLNVDVTIEFRQEWK